jgi:nucleoside-diphosphate-sugar epimerase
VSHGPVLVTGAGGWIGRAVAARLGPGAVALARVDLDCADRPRVESVIASVRPRSIVHLAASTDRGGGPERDRAQWHDTFGAARAVIESAAAAGVPHLVMAGTMDEVEPRTTYGLCKSLARQVAEFHAHRAPGLRVDWFRPTTVYGPGQRGTMLVPYACESAVAGRPADFTAGDHERDFLYVDDLIEWLTLAVDERVSLAAARGFHLHHLGTGKTASVRAVLALIEREIPGADFRLGALPTRAHEPAVEDVPAYDDPDPVLGAWRAKTGWHDGIRRTAAWWREVEAPKSEAYAWHR